MANPLAGEVELTLNGEVHVLKLTLGALAELEAELASETLLDLVRRCESGGARIQDILLLLHAGLRGGGWQGNPDELRSADIQGGLGEASRVAAMLLVRSFAPTGAVE